MERRLIIFNWIVGTLILAMTLLYPAFDERFMIDSKRMLAQNAVEHIARLEMRYHLKHEQYITFSGDKIPEAIQNELHLMGTARDDFVYDAFVAEDGQLVVRAQTSPDRIRSGSLPPLAYSLRINVNGLNQGKWEPLSRGKPG